MERFAAILWVVTLRVPFDAFAETVGRMLPKRVAFISTQTSGTLVTAADPSQQTTVASVAALSSDEVRRKLAESGFEVFDGMWTSVDPAELPCDTQELFVVAVAYRSAEARPGVWVDAFPQLPTTVQALRAMYEEFRSTGEVDDVSFEEFVRFASPNVVIVSPSDIRSYVDQKGG